MLYGVLAVLGSMGLVYLMIVLSHCLVLYSVALAKQKWLCFVAGLCCLASFKLEPFSSWQVGAEPPLCLVSSPPVSLSLGLAPGLCPNPGEKQSSGRMGPPCCLDDNFARVGLVMPRPTPRSAQLRTFPRGWRQAQQEPCKALQSF